MAPPQTAITADPSLCLTDQQFMLLGRVLWLCQFSPLHCDYRWGMLQDRFLGGIVRDQFRYYELNDHPIGFVVWAWVDEETDRNLRAARWELRPELWKCGPILWVPEILAPFGHGISIVADLRENVFPEGTVANALIVDPNTRAASVRTFR